MANWEEIKAAEKGRTSALDGVALSQPALSLINKLLYRAEKYGVDIEVPKHHALFACSAYATHLLDQFHSYAPMQ